MNELQAAAAAISSLKGAFDLSKSILETQNAAKQGAKIVELQSQILSAQQSAMAALQEQSALEASIKERDARIKELEAEVAAAKRFKLSKNLYRMVDAGAGAFVYEPEDDPTDSEPNYWLCVHCFDRGERSMMQNTGRSKDNQHSIFACHACKASFQVHWRAGPHVRALRLKAGQEAKAVPEETPPAASVTRTVRFTRG